MIIGNVQESRLESTPKGLSNNIMTRLSFITRLLFREQFFVLIAIVTVVLMIGSVLQFYGPGEETHEFLVPSEITGKGTLNLNHLTDVWNTQKTKLKLCPKKPASLAGRFVPSKEVKRPQAMAEEFTDMQAGGHYKPASCKAVEKTAILIPYRLRWNHLHSLLPVLIPLLMRQNVDFTIYVIEQHGNETFNKGILFNAGFLEALNVDNYDCFILHDVDMVPIDDRNMYRCNGRGPVHLSPAVNKFNYTILYEGLYGGVVTFTRHQFQLINGASNVYFGWGAEDDDLRDRAVNKNLTLLRKPAAIGVFDMVRHKRDTGFSQNPNRLAVFSTRHERQDIDGINSAIYKVISMKKLPIYTWLQIAVDKDKILATIPEDLKARKPKSSLNFRSAMIETLKE